MINLKHVVLILFASFCMAVNINTFVHTGGLYPGGVTGVTVLLQRVAELYFHVHLPYTAVNLVLNAVPIYIGVRYLGKRFVLYSLFYIITNNLFVDIIPSHVITYDTLLISIFGGLVNGFLVGVCLRQNASSGGTDFIALYLSDRKGMDSFNIILGFNCVVLVTAGVIFGWDKALYSIIFQFVSTQVLHLLYLRYQQHTLFIVTEKPDEMAAMIHRVTGNGATILPGLGSYSGAEKPVVYSVISSAGKDKVMARVHLVDPEAFVNAIKTEQQSGNFNFRIDE